MSPNSPPLAVLVALDGLGYRSLTEQIVAKKISEATRKVFDELGTHIPNLVIGNICTTYGLTEMQLFARYDLLEKSIEALFSGASRFFIKKIKDELLPFSITKNPELSLAKMAEEIEWVKVLEFVRDMSGNEHVGFLYGKKTTKDIVLSQFFGATASAAMISLSRGPGKFGVQQMTYEELLTMEKSEALSKMFTWFERIHKSNRSGRETRLAGEDATWFLRNGFEDQFLDAEKSLGCRVNDNTSRICSYYTEGITTERQLEKIIESHCHIIIDQPLAVYRAPR